MRRMVVLFCLGAGLPLLAQVGPYPGGGYPPGQYPGGYPPGRYPGGGGLPIPFPRKGKQGKADKNAPAEALQTFRGTVRGVSDKSISIEASDARVLDFKILEKTKFLKNGEEIKLSSIKVGDQVSIDAHEDDQGYLSAVNVSFEKAGEPSAKKPAEAAPSGKAPSGAAQPDAASSTVQPPLEQSPAAPDPHDPGPPTLRRGAPPRVETPEVAKAAKIDEPPPPPAVPAATAPAKRESVEAAAPPPTPSPKIDPLIEKARAASESFSEGLPNYVCKEFMARFMSTSRPVDWRPIDVVSTDVVYLDGRESYRNVAINGKPANKELEQIGGSWSTGEFGTVLRDIFSPATAADFRYDRQSTAGGVTVRVYTYEVQQPNSHWHVQVASQSINPAYKGSVWIDPKTGRVLRIEMQARRLPQGFPEDTVESAVDYEYVRIAGGQFLLPVHAEGLSCQRGTSNCGRNAIDFRNYHKYESESSITFEAPSK